MKYAVISINGNQYKVTEGEEFLVDRLKGKPEVQVLLAVNGEKVIVGEPFAKDVKVELEILGEEKGKKLYVQTYKAKSRYRRKLGFRAQLTRVKIGKISF